MIYYRSVKRKQETGKKILTFEDIDELVLQNRFPVTKKNRHARCIDGRYTSDTIGSLARPGADAGVMMELLAVNREYNIGLTHQLMEEIIVSVVKGYDNFYLHSDTHHKQDVLGCGHINEAHKDPSAYQLEKSDMDYMDSFLVDAQHKGAINVILEGEHNEGAVLIIRGEHWSVAPIGKTFVYHQALDDLRRKTLVDILLPYVDKSLKVSKEYLYDILTQVADNQRLETVRRLASQLPIYEVVFEKNGAYKVKSLIPNLSI